MMAANPSSQPSFQPASFLGTAASQRRAGAERRQPVIEWQRISLQLLLQGNPVCKLNHAYLSAWGNTVDNC